jgi:ABC-type nickel/cobalt efflux system permease component RcnA
MYVHSLILFSIYIYSKPFQIYIVYTIMNRLILSFIFCFTFLLIIQKSTVHADTCLHNERSKCTQVRNANELTDAENDHCHHLCIQSGHASGHCSLSSNCFQYCLCNEKEL